jgi:hypothetical protein
MLTEAAPPAESGESSEFISGVGQFVAKRICFCLRLNWPGRSDDNDNDGLFSQLPNIRGHYGL